MRHSAQSPVGESAPSPRPAAARKLRRRGSVVDIFCGAGGLTHGFRLEGFDVVAGIDADEACRFAYEHNNQAPFIRRDAAGLAASDVAELFYTGEPTILVGCAPCQPFSKYNQKNDDPKWRLVGRFAELICEVRPDVVSMENVPRLVDFQGGSVLRAFVDALERAGYEVWHEVAYLPDYGAPQRRSRLVLLASKHGKIELEKPSRHPAEYATVADTISMLPPLAAGEVSSTDALHRASAMSPTNLARIRASTPGGSWKTWDAELVADCHRAPTGKGYRSVYGRMRADLPSPTITTQFFGFGNGRFGHPSQDRGLSLREGALLQSFPRDYSFLPPGVEVRFKTLGRMIGNAVPVCLARAIARSIDNHIEEKGL